MQNDLQHAEAIADAARHDREAAMAQASQAQNHLDQLSSTVQQLVQRNEQAAKVSPTSLLQVSSLTTAGLGVQPDYSLIMQSHMSVVKGHLPLRLCLWTSTAMQSFKVIGSMLLGDDWLLTYDAGCPIHVECELLLQPASLSQLQCWPLDLWVSAGTMMRRGVLINGCQLWPHHALCSMSLFPSSA